MEHVGLCDFGGSGETFPESWHTRKDLFQDNTSPCFLHCSHHSWMCLLDAAVWEFDGGKKNFLNKLEAFNQIILNF